jgi:hypothetical protein
VPDIARARPWLRPPALRAPTPGEHDERHASWLELFFDLVVVVAIAQLAQELARDHSLGGFATFAGLFLPVFIAWQGFTFYADRFDSDDVLFRAVMLAAMLAIAALAVQIPDVAAGRHDGGFVVAYVTLRSLLVALYLRAWPHAPEARPLIARYAGGYSLSIALWLSSLLVDPPLRYVLWGVGLAIEYAMPVVAQRIHARIPVDPSHVPERFALFTIIVLGESVVAVALGTADTDWRAASATTAALGFVASRACGGCTSTAAWPAASVAATARCRSTPASTSRCSRRLRRSAPACTCSSRRRRRATRRRARHGRSTAGPRSTCSASPSPSTSPIAAPTRAARALAGLALVALAALVGAMTPVSIVACSAAALLALVVYEIRLRLAEEAA